MIGYFSILKLKRGFTQFNSIWTFLGKVLITLFVGLYGFLFGMVYNEFTIEEADISPQMLVNYLLIGLMVMSLVRMIIPSYQPLKKIAPTYYPLSQDKKILLSYISDLISPVYYLITVFVLTACFFIQDLGFGLFMACLSIILIGLGLKRAIQTLIEFKTPKYSFLLLILSLGLTIWGFTSSELLMINQNFNNIPIAIIVLGLCYYVEKTATERQIIVRKQKERKRNIYFKIIINHPIIRRQLLLAIVIKIGFLAIDTAYVLDGGRHLISGTGIYWVLAAPALPFTYLFNNAIAALKPVWLNYELRTGNFKGMMKLIAKLMVLPLAIDAIVTIPTLLYTWEDSTRVLTFYFTALLFLIMSSFLLSVLAPIKLDQTGGMKMKGKRATISQFSIMISLVILSLIGVNDWLYLLVPFFLIVGVVAFQLTKEMYPSKKYSLFEVLNKK